MCKDDIPSLKNKLFLNLKDQIAELTKEKSRQPRLAIQRIKTKQRKFAHTTKTLNNRNDLFKETKVNNQPGNLNT